MKLQIRFDVLTGTFQHFQLTDGMTADTKAEKQFEPLPAGSLRLADLGYFSLDGFERLTQTGVFWITKFKVGCPLLTNNKNLFVYRSGSPVKPQTPSNLSCFIGASKRLPAYLVALRVSEEEATSVADISDEMLNADR